MRSKGLLLAGLLCAVTSCGDPGDAYNSYKPGGVRDTCPPARLSCETRFMWVMLPLPYTSCTCLPTGSTGQKLVALRVRLLAPDDATAQRLVGVIERSLDDVDEAGRPRSTPEGVAAFRRQPIAERVKVIADVYPDAKWPSILTALRATGLGD